MVAIPLMKMLSMTVKTVAKPVAKQIKSEAEKHRTIRGGLHSMGQATNSLSLRVSVRMAGHTTTKIKPLDEDKAVAAGGDLLAEGFVYVIGAALMVWEYRASAKDKERKDAAANVKKAVEQQELAEVLKAHDQRLAALEALAAVDDRKQTRDGINTVLDIDSDQKDERLPPPVARWWSPLGRFLGRDEGALGRSTGRKDNMNPEGKKER